MNPISISHGLATAPPYFRATGTTGVRWPIVIAVSDRFQTTGPWSNTEKRPMHTGSAIAVTSILGASTRSGSTTYRVSITITAGNAIAFSNLKSRGSNTWRPSTGIAERTIRSAFYCCSYQVSEGDETDVAHTYCRSSGLKLPSNRTTARATTTTSAHRAKRSVTLCILAHLVPPPRTTDRQMNINSCSTVTRSSRNTTVRFTPTVLPTVLEKQSRHRV
jgi:hypothetical protein